MSLKTGIQWCDSTVNPVVGCDGCPLLPTSQQIRRSVEQALTNTEIEHQDVKLYLPSVLKDYGPSELYHRRNEIACALGEMFSLSEDQRKAVAKAVSERFRCYAAQIHYVIASILLPWKNI